MIGDLRLSLRNLGRSPGFTLTAVLTLALGIGAATTVFSVVYGVLYRPLPYADPGSLVAIEAEVEFPSGIRPMNFSGPEVPTMEAETRAFSNLGAVNSSATSLRTEAGAEDVVAVLVSKGLFPTLGRSMLLGRGLGDDREPVAVISYRLWRRVFGGAVDIIGRGITLTNRQGGDAQVFTVVGVAPPDFGFPNPGTDVWKPLGFARSSATGQVNNRSAGGFWFVGRLRNGATVAEATRDVGNVIDRLRPGLNELRRGSRPKVTLLADRGTSAIGPMLLTLLAAVTFVLLIACANVANLVLARQDGRVREIAVRLALGAPPGRLIRLLLTETLVIALFGAVLGTILASGAVLALGRLKPAQIPRLEAIHVDLPVMAFAMSAAIVATLISGLIPALMTPRRLGSFFLIGNSRSSTSSGATRRLRAILVVSEVAVSVVLLVGASLLARSLAAMVNADLGVSRDHVLAAELNLAVGRTIDDARLATMVEGLSGRLRAHPDVRSIGVGNGLPPASEFARVGFELNNAANPGGRAHLVTLVPATAGYFSTLEIPLLRGRMFTDSDTAGAQSVALINREAARRFFGDSDPIGMSLPIRGNDPEERVGVVVVGVVDNVKFTGFTGPDEATVFRPYAQSPVRLVFLVARTISDPSAVAADLRQVVRSYDKDIKIDKVQSLDRWVSDEVGPPRFRALLLSSIAVIALLLAAIGLYGVIAYSVAQRTSEIGIRMALGAQPRDITRLVVGDGLRMAVAGTLLGLAGSFALRQTLASFVYQVKTGDPASFALSATILLAVAVVACYVPSRRAMRVDPVVALRSE